MRGINNQKKNEQRTGTGNLQNSKSKYLTNIWKDTQIHP